jgi:ribosomal protein S18 acetylase RimI-like enzyme
MPTSDKTVLITRFEPQHQHIVHQLILEGLAEHWGTLDPTLNQDLADISHTYCTSVFLLAWLDNKLVGTGVLVRESESVSRVMRMSVDKAHRRLGIATLILKRLLKHAQAQGQQKIVLETTATWDDAIAFYKRTGFHPVALRDGDLHFELYLSTAKC